jgi:hypothetical protein
MRTAAAPKDESVRITSRPSTARAESPPARKTEEGSQELGGESLSTTQNPVPGPRFPSLSVSVQVPQDHHPPEDPIHFHPESEPFQIR